jgi:ferredoxin
MATLLVHSEAGELHLHVVEGDSVRDALDTTELRVRAACGGTGSCGACVVRLLHGEVNPPTLAEYMKLSPEER